VPTYVYARQSDAKEEGCSWCRLSFEKVQRMSEEALTVCPNCGAPIERVLQAPMLGNVDNALKGPSDAAIKAAGFTKFKRAGKGKYEKQFGGGPGTIG